MFIKININNIAPEGELIRNGFVKALRSWFFLLRGFLFKIKTMENNLKEKIINLKMIYETKLSYVTIDLETISIEKLEDILNQFYSGTISSEFLKLKLQGLVNGKIKLKERDLYNDLLEFINQILNS